MTASVRALDFVLDAPANNQTTFLTAQAQVGAASGYTNNATTRSGAVLQSGQGSHFFLCMRLASTNSTGSAPVTVATGIKWAPTADAAGNLWRKVAPGRQPTYVINLGTSIVYVAISGVASNGVGLPLLPGAAPDYVGGSVTDLGSTKGAISVWTLPGGRFGYGEE